MAEPSELEMRSPRRADAASIHRLVRESESLEANSLYAYLLICRDFSQTSLVACDREGLLGFVAGYRLPEKPEAVFVWQIGVARRARRRGVAKKMLARLCEAERARGTRYLEATVAPSNAPSRGLFQSLAESLSTPLQILPGFTIDEFGDEPHEAEELIRIGPLQENP